MRFNTGNPVGTDGSSDPRDLYDNAGIIDLLVNGPLGEYLGRLGVPLKSWLGIMQQVTDHLIAQGYESTYLVYGADVIVERQTQLIQRDGELYRVMSAGDVPLTLTGTWATDAPKLQAVGDAALRQTLSSGDGSSMIGHGELRLNEVVSPGLPLPARPAVDIFIIYGQSNSVGWALNTPGYPDVVTDWAMAFDDRVKGLGPVPKALYSGAGQESTGHGWAEFANVYVQMTGRKLVLLSCGLGGLSIASLSKGGEVYGKMVSAVSSCKSAVAGLGEPVGNVYAIFNQGEQDLRLSTSKWDYKAALVKLIADMKTDFGIAAFFIQLCGSPRSSYGTESELSRLHLTQREVCVEVGDVALASAVAASFTVFNGMLQSVDGVHYTQAGYNLLGRDTATSVAAFVMDLSKRSNISMQEYGSLALGKRRRWQSVYARFLKSAGTFKLMSEAASSNLNALSCVDSISVDSTGVNLGLTVNNFTVAGESIDITHEATARCGVSVFAARVSIDPATGRNGLRFTFIADLSILVSSNGSIRSLRNSAEFNKLITDNVVATASDGVVTLKFASVEGFPSVSGYGAGAAYISAASSVSVSVGFSGGATLAVVNARVFGINPLSVPDGCEFSASYIMANAGE